MIHAGAPAVSPFRGASAERVSTVWKGVTGFIGVNPDVTARDENFSSVLSPSSSSRYNDYNFFREILNSCI